MNCAEFERDVARLLAEEVAENRRPAMLGALHGHIATCADCRGTSDLLELMARPAAERALADEPDPAYWSEFTDRVSRRIRKEPRRARRVWLPGAWVVAASAVVVAGLLWLARPDHTPAPNEPPGDAVVDGGIVGPGRSEDRPPGEIVADPELDELAEILVDRGGAWDSDSHDSGGGWLFPETEQLDSETRKKFLEWLEQQNSTGRGVTS